MQIFKIQPVRLGSEAFVNPSSHFGPTSSNWFEVGPSLVADHEEIIAGARFHSYHFYVLTSTSGENTLKILQICHEQIVLRESWNLA
jgi:hypothetical protein